MPVRDLTLLRRHYTATAGCVLDILSVLPTDVFYLLPPITHNRPYVRLATTDQLILVYVGINMNTNSINNFKMSGKQNFL